MIQIKDKLKDLLLRAYTNDTEITNQIESLNKIKKKNSLFINEIKELITLNYNIEVEDNIKSSLKNGTIKEYEPSSCENGLIYQTSNK